MAETRLSNDPLLSGVPVHKGYKVLGGVVLYQKLGQGGMGAVYRGRHLRLNIDVALKVMDPPAGVQVSRAGEFVRRFIREAQTAAAVQHQNLIRVYDVNAESGVNFLIMDFVDGESASDRLKRKGKLSEAEAVEIALGAADGLAAAHAKGIVHRDVKPDNIMIDKEGKVRVADLGLAKATSTEEAGEPSSLTHSAAAIGTPHYMSPEQFESARDVRAPADVWSLGVTLFQLLTGGLPWQGSTVFQIIAAMQTQPPKELAEFRDDLSPGVVAIVGKALQKDTSERYADCGGMAEALRSHLDSICTSAESVLPDAKAGAMKMALVSVTPPPSRTLTLIAEADVSPAPGSQKAPAPPRAEAKWFYARGDTRHGPLTSQRLKELAREGVVTPQTLIWKEGLAEWIPASRTKGLFTASSKFESPPPLPGSQEPKGPPPLPGSAEIEHAEFADKDADVPPPSPPIPMRRQADIEEAEQIDEREIPEPKRPRIQSGPPPTPPAPPPPRPVSSRQGTSRPSRPSSRAGYRSQDEPHGTRRRSRSRVGARGAAQSSSIPTWGKVGGGIVTGVVVLAAVGYFAAGPSNSSQSHGGPLRSGAPPAVDPRALVGQWAFAQQTAAGTKGGFFLTLNSNATFEIKMWETGAAGRPVHRGTMTGKWVVSGDRLLLTSHSGSDSLPHRIASFGGNVMVLQDLQTGLVKPMERMR